MSDEPVRPVGRLGREPNITVVGLDQPETGVFTVEVVARFDPSPGLDRIAEAIKKAWTVTLVLPNGDTVGSTGADTFAGPDEMTHRADFDRSSLTAGDLRVQIGHPDLSTWETVLAFR